MKCAYRSWCGIVSLLALSAPALSFAAKSAPSLESKVREFHLENGLTILVVENHDSPTIGLSTCFRVGGAEEHPGVNGVTHILEHMLFKGTTEIGTKDWTAEKPHFDRVEELTLDAKREKAKGIAADTTRIRELLDERAKEEAAANEFVVDNELMGLYDEVGAVNLNAFTSYDVTAYILALPSNRLDLWMKLESERLRRPILRQFYTEIENILEERRLRVDADPEGRLDEGFLAAAYDAHWYGYPIIGYPSDLRTVTRTETEEWFSRYYAPNQVTLAIVGDVDPENVRALAQKSFGDLPRRDPPEPLETFDLPKAGERRIEVEYDAEPRLRMGWHKPNAPSADDAALRIVSQLLAGGPSSRLVKSLVEEKQIAASVATDHEFPGARWPNLFSIQALPRAPHDARELEGALWEELERLKNEPVSVRELQKAKNQIKAAFVRDMESNFGLAVALAVAQASFQDWRVMLQAQSAIDAVTPEDVRRVARETFKKNRTIVATVVKPAAEADPAREEAGARVLARMTKALGSPESLAAIRSLEATSEVAITTPAGSMTAQSKTIYALPDRMASEMTVFGQKMNSVATPSGAWRTQQGKAVDVEGDEATELRADFEREMFLLGTPDGTARSTVEGFLDDKTASRIEVRGPSGRVFVVTLEPKSGLPESATYESKNPMSGAKARFVETYSDWRVVNGVRRPHKILTSIDGAPFAEATITTVRINPPIDASAFEKPAL